MVCEKCVYLNGKNADGAAATLEYKSAGKVSVRDAEVGDRLSWVLSLELTSKKASSRGIKGE
jgi:hypothetical protein